MLPALRVRPEFKAKEGKNQKGQLCLMSLLALWIAPGFCLCPEGLFILFCGGNQHSKAVGTGFY